MIIDYADFTRASNLIHPIQGAALLLLGAAEAYALDNDGRRLTLSAAAALALSGALMFAVILALPGRWSPAQLAVALSVRRGFYIFVSFACVYSAAGLSLLTKEALGRGGGGWLATFLGLLAFAGVLYFVLAWRVDAEAWRRVLVWHAAIGGTLLLAVAARAADVFRPRRPLRLAWAALLLLTGFQLALYRETASAFAPRLITVESSTGRPGR